MTLNEMGQVLWMSRISIKIKILSNCPGRTRTGLREKPYVNQGGSVPRRRRRVSFDTDAFVE